MVDMVNPNQRGLIGGREGYCTARVKSSRSRSHTATVNRCFQNAGRHRELSSGNRFLENTRDETFRRPRPNRVSRA